jgi:hypothetical protein
MGLHDEVIPVLARNCVNRVKVLRSVEIHGDRRADLEHAFVKLLTLWFIEGEEIRRAALREGLRHGPGVPLRDRLRSVVQERMAPRSARSRRDRLRSRDVVTGAPRSQTGSAHELAKRSPECPILVQLCLDLLRSSDFAEIEATNEELARALEAALADAPRTFADRLERALRVPRPRLRPAVPSLPSEVLLEKGVRRFLDWLRGGGGPPLDGPGGSCPPPAVPV